MNNLIRFFERYYYVFLFLILEGVAVYLISVNSYYQGSFITNIANNIAGNTFNQLDKVTHYFYLASANEELVRENARLRAEIESSYVKFTKKEFEVNDTVYKQQFTFIESKIISKSTNKRNNYFMLNKGSSSGITKDMSVIAQNGIVGVVIQVTDNFALVMSVLHQDSKVAVRNKRTMLTGTLSWEGGSYTTGQVIDMPSSIPLKKGDTIVTSGFSRNLPEGIDVGYVKSFEKDKGTGFYNIDIKFSVDYNKLEYVYVVKNFFKIEQDELEKGMKDG
ncbi:MAG TPA: rod shape-determining protein MreC [Candidatus Onthomorpha intestinigallinarum]|uniref:Cell shape-determining protein MreC n=1 Tax=Candidatus Onthomorpha intestinigallinarum TaxID=2840880 RepID=A0A9D1RGC1_9BACT|nr:rod shape-determining protein MreC [Candidatus Onthomorpha intestinigallinarum]